MNKREGFIDKYSGIVSYLLVYSYSLSFVIDILFSTTSHVLVYFTTACGLLIMFMVLYDLLCRRTIYKYEFSIGIFIVAIIILVTLTKLKYPQADMYFSGTYKSLLVRTVPCAFAGMLVARHNSLKKTEFFLLPVTFMVTIVLFTTILKNATGNLKMYITLGIDRQTMSYLAAYMICWLVYCWIYFDSLLTPKLFRTAVSKLIIVILIIINTWPLFAGGGRGAIVVIVAFLLFLVFVHIRPLHSPKGMVIAFFGVIMLILSINKLSTIQMLSGGLQRISSLFNRQLDQSSLERITIFKKAFLVFRNHPILGNGAGSVICQIGIWSHNVFLDILADFGVVGLVVFLFVFVKALKTVLRRIKTDRSLEIAFYLGMGSFIMLCFSGSYLSDGGLWFFVVYALSYDKLQRIGYRNNNEEMYEQAIK